MKKMFIFVLFVLVLCGCEKEKVIEMSTSISNPVLITSKNTVKNGETVTLTTDIKGTINGKPILFSVKYFCDQDEIGSSNDGTSKYRYDYHVENLTVGSHKLSSKVESNEGGVSSYGAASVLIEVTE